MSKKIVIRYDDDSLFGGGCTGVDRAASAAAVREIEAIRAENKGLTLQAQAEQRIDEMGFTPEQMDFIFADWADEFYFCGLD